MKQSSTRFIRAHNSFLYEDNEHETLISQIEELKTALEHAQMLRRRKIEYDLVAEKVNTLPSREELESYVFSCTQAMAICHNLYFPGPYML